MGCPSEQQKSPTGQGHDLDLPSGLHPLPSGGDPRGALTPRHTSCYSEAAGGSGRGFCGSNHGPSWAATRSLTTGPHRPQVPQHTGGPRTRELM